MLKERKKGARGDLKCTVVDNHEMSWLLLRSLCVAIIVYISSNGIDIVANMNDILELPLLFTESH